MKDYELSILFHPDLEMNLDPALDKVKSLIEANTGVIIKEEAEGKKRLSYKINGQDYAVYYYYDLQLPPEAPQKLNTALGIADEVLRSLLVRTDARKAKYAARAGEQPSEDTEEAKEEVKEEA